MATGRIGSGGSGRCGRTQVAVQATAGALLFQSAPEIAIRAQMKAEYLASTTAPDTWGGRLYKFAQMAADRTVGQGLNNDINTGYFPAFIYTVTGDASYAQKAYAQLSFNIFPYIVNANGSMDANVVREYGCDLAIVYDWIYTGITEDQRATFRARMHQYYDQVAHHVSGGAGLGDSDQICGYYAGILAWYVATKAHNPYATVLFNGAFMQGQTVPTGDNYATARNAIYHYCTVPGAGGEWIESSEYNHHTMTFVLQILAIARQLPAIANDFPDIEAMLEDVAYKQIYTMTTDYLGRFQFGDEEKPHHFRPWEWQTTSLMLLGLMDDGQARQDLLRSLEDLWTANIALLNYNSSDSIFPTPRPYPVINPYGTKSADLTHLDKGRFMSGQGQSVHRTSLAATACNFWAQNRPESRGDDHMSLFFGDFQMYRKQTWVLTHPFGYGFWWMGSAWASDLYNCHTVESCTSVAMYGGNTASNYQFRRITGHREEDDWIYQTGTQGGSLFPHYNIDGGVNWGAGALGVFIHEDTRSILKLSSTSGKSDVVVIMDRINATDPALEVNYAQQYNSGGFRIRDSMAREARWQWYLHMPEQPVIASADVSWTPHKTTRQQGGSTYGWGTADTAQAVKCTWLYPALPDAVITPQQETTLTDDLDGYRPGSVRPEQRAWRIKVTPASAQQWNPLLAVIAVTDAGETVTATMVEDGANDAIGALISRASDEDVLAVFNAIEGAEITQAEPTPTECAAVLLEVRLRTSGYTINWDPSSATTLVKLFDLHPSTSWSYTIDGGASTPLTVDANGIGEFSVSGSGAHALVLTGV
jgi:hypothetical protein